MRSSEGTLAYTELVDEPVAGDDLVGVQQQGGEQGALLRATERGLVAILQYLQ